MSEPQFHRDRREHGGAPQRLDENTLDELTEDERVDAGLDAYNPDEVPSATDPLPPGVPPSSRTSGRAPSTRTPRPRSTAKKRPGELPTLDADHPFPPTRYDNS